jgi:hypothetical protein
MKAKVPSPPKKATPKSKRRGPLEAKAAEPRGGLDPRLAALAKLFVKDPRVTLGKAFSSITLKVNGKIFAMVAQEGKLVFKLPKARVDELVAKKAGHYFDSGRGRLMKEWLTLDAAKPEPAKLAREACAFVGELG